MSLIGSHTASVYPDKKPTWRYIKGSEKDFEGAPEWANFIIFSITFNNTYAVESMDWDAIQNIYNLKRHHWGTTSQVFRSGNVGW